jgi:hypothetical protein
MNIQKIQRTLTTHGCDVIASIQPGIVDETALAMQRPSKATKRRKKKPTALAVGLIFEMTPSPEAPEGRDAAKLHRRDTLSSGEA